MSGTAAPSRLLPSPAPPHDPWSLLLSGTIGPTPQIGWRLHRLASVDIEQGSRGMVLSPAPAAARWLTEPNGSFGGLRPPANLAVTPRADILLLDPATGAIRRFDACACRFVNIPCTARIVALRDVAAEGLGPSRLPAPRDRLLDPQGIAACGGDLVISDRGHHRIACFALNTFVPRNPLRLPATERRAMAPAEWQPTGLVFDGHGRLIVSDPVNGRLDWFSPAKRWLRKLSVEVGAGHVAIDCRDRVLVVVTREFRPAIANSSSTVTLEVDAGTDGFQWHTLQLASLGPSSRLAVDVHAGDDPWTAAQRDDPANTLWSRWLDADATGRAANPLALGGRAGRYLRLRFTPAAGHVSAPFDAIASGARVWRVDGEVEELVTQARADLVGDFGTPPIVVDQLGQLHLPCEQGIQVFDARGEPVADASVAGDLFEREGRHISTAIDSAIDACQWHRIELRGAIPPGCSIEVATTTAEIELKASELDSVPEEAWSRATPARAMEPGTERLGTFCNWDVLIGSGPGRFLWVRLVLRGDGRDTPCVSSALIEYPRISLRRYLPGVFGMDPAGADFTDRFAAIFDRTLRSIESHLDLLPLYFDPASAPVGAAAAGRPDFLSWLGEWIGVSLSREWPEARRRRFIKEVARIYSRLGTADGLRRQLLLLLGFDPAYQEHCLAERPRRRCIARPRNCGSGPPREPAEPPPLILEHFRLRRWLYVGHGRLGSDAELWGRRIVGRSELSGGGERQSGQAQIGVTRLDTTPDPLHDPFLVTANKFSVFVPARIRERPVERRALEQLVAREAPAHTLADIRYVEPRFRVGVQAMIGLDSVVARTPLGVTLDASRLRQGAILTPRPGAPHLALGNARVGATTRLT